MANHKPTSTSFIQKDIKAINKSVIHPSLHNHANRTASLYNNAHQLPTQSRFGSESVIDFKIQQ